MLASFFSSLWIWWLIVLKYGMLMMSGADFVVVVFHFVEGALDWSVDKVSWVLVKIYKDVMKVF